VFDFAESRAGRHVQTFFGQPTDAGWRGTLICDDYAGYKALLRRSDHRGRLPGACAAQVLRPVGQPQEHGGRAGAGVLRRLYDVEREVADLDVDERRRIRQLKAQPMADALQAWLLAQRQKVPEGSATARAIDYSLNRWTALTRYLGDGALPADNNWIENRIRPIALGRTTGCSPAACAPDSAPRRS
jgi:transposase